MTKENTPSAELLTHTVFERHAARTTHRWSFIRLGLWASLAVLVMLILVGAWSYRQTNQMMLESQERTGKAIAAGLSSAVEEDLIVKNYAQLEVRLMQVMAGAQISAALVADASGKVLSEVQRDPRTSEVSVVFNDGFIRNPEAQPTTSRTDDVLDIFYPVGGVVPSGWVKLRVATTPDDALLGGIHQQLLLLLSLGAITMLMVVGFSLWRTYSRVQTAQMLIEELNDSLHSAAFYDALTQLPNRHLLADRLKQALAMAARSNKHLAVCYLDLDGFKQVNDQYGHDTGDALLIEVCQRMLKAVRQHDTVARVGGDEFVLLISDLESINACELILSRLLGDLARPFHVNGHNLQVGASIGVAMHLQHGSDPATLIRMADKAMYSAKCAGKNRYCFF